MTDRERTEPESDETRLGGLEARLAKLERSPGCASAAVG